MFKLNEAKSSARRERLLSKMKLLNEQEIHCGNCTGKCCTSVANSMQCSPIEAVEVYLWLNEMNLWNDEMVLKIKKCIKDYRLDYEIPTTRGVPLRRTYTCPFFNNGALGCLLKPEIKPYGCLGFNPKSKKIVDGEDCASDLEMLEDRDLSWNEFEDVKNQELTLKLKLDWTKLPMPIALLDVMERLDKIGLEE